MSEIEKIDGYRKLIQIVEDYELEDMRNAKEVARKRVFAFEFEDKHKIKLSSDITLNGNGFYAPVNARLGCMCVANFGEKHNRRILNIKKEIDDEVLLEISFSTGAYIFGDDYPKEFFSKFYAELKAYEPKYCDDLNHCLYFSMDNAMEIFNAYRDICEKYIKENQNDFLRRKAEKLRKEAERIESKLTPPQEDNP